MRAEHHLEVLRREGDRLASMPIEALGAPVPAVEGWDLERVVRHTGKVHQWVAALISAGPGADTDAVAVGVAGMPKGPDCLPAYRDALELVVGALSGRDAAEPAATFVGAGTVGFWCRRQAHEVTVHRVDAADAVHAAGGPAPEPIDPAGAADGIDEWAHIFLATRWHQRFGELPADLVGRTVHIHGTDDTAPGPGAEWLLTLGADAIEVSNRHAKGDVALRGTCADLLLTLWRRRPPSGIEILGDEEVARRLLDVARF